MDQGVWQATVYGVTRVKHDWVTRHIFGNIVVSAIKIISFGPGKQLLPGSSPSPNNARQNDQIKIKTIWIHECLFWIIKYKILCFNTDKHFSVKELFIIHIVKNPSSVRMTLQNI